MIEINNLSFQYPLTPKPVFANVNLRIESGTLTLVTGASGSGKSTLLRCINGLVPHFTGGTIHGHINVLGLDPIKSGPGEMSKKVGFVFQEPEAQFIFDTVEDEIALGLETEGIPRAEMHRRVDRVLDRMNLQTIRTRKLTEISGGEQQRVAIAAALVAEPNILILDEPTSQLDPDQAAEVLEYLVKMKLDWGLSVLISEHRLERLLKFTDQIIHFSSDSHLLSGTPQDILPRMAQVPPIIELARRLDLTPLPLTSDSFPQILLDPKPPTPIERCRETQNNPSIALQIEEVSTQLGKNKILNHVSLELRTGEILTLMGPNGSGKTTLLRSILGLIPSNGKRILFGENIESDDISKVIKRIAYLPQNPNDLLFAETVLVEMQTTLKNHQQRMTESELKNFLAKFGLQDKQDRYPRDLSVGERQRTALAAITVHNPDIILLDEPTRGLDYKAKKALKSILQIWRSQEKAILVVSHDVEFSANIADRSAILEGGEIIFSGNPRTAFSKYPSYRTQTAQVFPDSGWITPDDVQVFS